MCKATSTTLLNHYGCRSSDTQINCKHADTLSEAPKIFKLWPNRKKIITPFEELKFLNIPEKDSTALVAVRIRGEVSGTKRYEDNYEIKITDCSNTVTLHGNLKNPESRKNSLNKFDSLIEVLTNARNHIEKELKEKNLRF